MWKLETHVLPCTLFGEYQSSLLTKLLTYLKPLIEVNPMSMSIHISIFCLRPYIISHNSQCGYIIGTLKHIFGLKLR
jgi:hypothetical protein